MTDTFDRSQLDGKDREQLSEIASALGVKAISRMRKADLVDAIVSATAGANGSGGAGAAARPRKIRSTSSGGDDLASLAAEEDALATGSEPRRRHDADPAPAARRRGRQRRGPDRLRRDRGRRHPAHRRAGSGRTRAGPARGRELVPRRPVRARRLVVAAGP